jgi:hypothetical protein
LSLKRRHQHSDVLVPYSRFTAASRVFEVLNQVQDDEITRPYFQLMRAQLCEQARIG